MSRTRQDRRPGVCQASTGAGLRSCLSGAMACAGAIGFLAASAQAVVIAGPDGSINTTPPPSQDPGFANVGVLNGLSGVYLRNGWVLTANHVGIGAIELAGTSYAPVPGSVVRFTNAAGPDPDLIAFKLIQIPALPDLAIASAPPTVGEDIVMIGNGRNRGAALAPWNGMHDGWALGGGKEVRWGTNEIELTGLTVLSTESFRTRFDDLPGQMGNDPEAQAVNGDSGGGAFVWNGGAPELIGILFAQGLHEGQSSNEVFFDNVAYASDLHHYRSQIEALIDLPGCSNGIDEDGDGLTDYPADPGCDTPADPTETIPLLTCDNGIDDDLDGLADWPADGGCESLFDISEVPEPGLVQSLFAGILALMAATRKRREA